MREKKELVDAYQYSLTLYLVDANVLTGSSHICSIQIDVCVCFLPIYPGRQVRWMYQPESHRRKGTQDFLSTFLLRFMPLFFLVDREVEFCVLTI